MSKAGEGKCYTSYYLREIVRDEIKELAEEMRVSASKLAEKLLIRGLRLPKKDLSNRFKFKRPRRKSAKVMNWSGEASMGLTLKRTREIFDNFSTVQAKLGFSTREVAEACGITKQGVARWKHGSLPSLQLAIKFQDFIVKRLSKNGKPSESQTLETDNGLLASVALRDLIATDPIFRKWPPSSVDRTDETGDTPEDEGFREKSKQGGAFHPTSSFE